VKWVKNKNINSKIQNSIICNDTIFEVKKFHESIPEYKATPIKRLKNFAKFCGLSEIYVKDESYRFGLNSFKVLGASYAIGKYIASKLNKSISEMSFDKLISDETKEKLGCLTFVSATDGNHGRGVAWATRKLGHNGIIYMPKGSTQNRVNHIRQMGAKVIVTEFNYDDTVRLAAREAKKNAWSIIQDTAWEDYADIPTWIMQGYSTIANEVVAQLKGKQPTHVFLQVGVGSFASMVADIFVSIFKKNPPKIVIVEPEESNCFYSSICKGKLKAVTGKLNTIMAGLACGEPNPNAWNILKDSTDISISAPDWMAAKGMRILGNPLEGDPKVISGESGAITTGVLSLISKDEKYLDFKKRVKSKWEIKGYFI
jgi:diaminopropionate ammonia-lyase